MSNNGEFNSKEFLNQKHIEAEQLLLKNEKYAKNIQNYIDNYYLNEYKDFINNRIIQCYSDLATSAAENGKVSFDIDIIFDYEHGYICLKDKFGILSHLDGLYVGQTFQFTDEVRNIVNNDEYEPYISKECIRNCISYFISTLIDYGFNVNYDSAQLNINDTEYKLLVTNLYVFKNLYKFFGKKVRDNISINVSF